MTSLAVTARSVADLSADVVVLGAFSGGDAPTLAVDLPAAALDHLTTALSALGFTAAAESSVVLVAVPGLDARRVVVVGLGARPEKKKALDAAVLRRSVGAALRSIIDAERVAVALPVPSADHVAAVAEGAALGAYRFTAQRGTSDAPTVVDTITIVSERGRDSAVKAAVSRASAVAQAVGYARDLVNTAPNLLYPQTFADSVKQRAAGTKVKVAVLDEKALVKGGFGGIVGVGQGSVHPPRIVSLSYAPAGKKSKLPHLALVGKGMTFDSGGLDIKPANHMANMKSDMAGAAAVAGAVLAIAELGLPIRVTGWLGLAENMPSGSAQRASDVVTMHNGMTVEILNTDAEGRMVLADVMTLAGEESPTAIVDIATLTGAQVVALGLEVAAVMGNDDEFRTRVCSAGDDMGEDLWPMPLPAAYRKGLDTEVADIAHKGGPAGGMLTAGLFLQEFVPQVDGEAIPWAHVDIAGPSFNEQGPRGFTPKGGTGFGVATLVRLAELLSQS
ncbi:leucyl aminopeptidase [Arsenicicoccus sp. oral taxon 190]|uniref:leucyl aminopeptidase n=1 Tax=Arsenicicoccus sp. oral taxon 190 TaxID=1658671 RepID=UPI00067A3E1A|nr:leucyl aminopeptidase [Arsenicicoccus sp. oral taxon 190]AKT52098.1 aminopeptidase A [Arsenicicoccus sp. oral taxon 190]